MKKGIQGHKRWQRIKVMGCKVARILPYNKLTPKVKSIEIKGLYSVRDDFCYDLDDEEKVNGCYRHLAQFLPLLAIFSITTAQQSGEDLLWFNDDVNTFHVLLGGDGAPFGKDDTASSWLVSFLNRGKHVLSSGEIFLVFWC